MQKSGMVINEGKSGRHESKIFPSWRLRQSQGRCRSAITAPVPFPLPPLFPFPAPHRCCFSSIAASTVPAIAIPAGVAAVSVATAVSIAARIPVAVSSSIASGVPVACSVAIAAVAVTAGVATRVPVFVPAGIAIAAGCSAPRGTTRVPARIATTRTIVDRIAIGGGRPGGTFRAGCSVGRRLCCSHLCEGCESTSSPAPTDRCASLLSLQNGADLHLDASHRLRQ